MRVVLRFVVEEERERGDELSIYPYCEYCFFFLEE